MGAWGYGNFSNDAALDWLGDTVDSNDPDRIAQAIDQISNMPEDDDLEDDICCAALAAIEFLATAQAQPASDFPEQGIQFMHAHSIGVTPELIAKAVRVIARIRDASELSELYATSGKTVEWMKVLDDLLDRVQVQK